MSLRPKPVKQPWRLGEWPVAANADDSTPIKTCPNCGGHSSDSHLCRPAKTTKTSGEQK